MLKHCESVRELERRLCEESDQFRLSGPESRTLMVWDRLGEILLEIAKLREEN